MTEKQRMQKKDFFLDMIERKRFVCLFFNFMKLLVKTIIIKGFLVFVPMMYSINLEPR